MPTDIFGILILVVSSVITFTVARRLSRGWREKLHILDLCKAFGWSNINQAQTYYNPTAADIARRL